MPKLVDVSKIFAVNQSAVPIEPFPLLHLRRFLAMLLLNLFELDGFVFRLLKDFVIELFWRQID